MNESVSPGFYPPPRTSLRLAGAAGIVGAVLWPVTLIVLAVAAGDCASTDCAVDRGSLALAALAPVTLAIAVAGLELRAARTPVLGDLVGDLTVGTAAALFVLAFVTGALGPVGPGLLLLMIGSLIFGAVGYLKAARPRMPSALVAIGSGSLLLFLFGGAAGGGGTLGNFATPSLVSLLLFSIGWSWLGGHLLLARPLPLPDRK